MTWTKTGDNFASQTVSSSSPTYTGLTAGVTGDLRVFAHIITGTTTTISSLSGGGVTTWHKLSGPFTDSSNTGNEYEIWAGVITGNATTITVNLSANPSSTTYWFQIDVRSTNGVGSWSGSAQANGHASGASSTNIGFPNLTSGNLGEIYLGFGFGANTVSAGSTINFTYDVDSANAIACYNLGLSGTTSYNPSASQSPTGAEATIAVIIDDGAPVPITYNYEPVRLANPNTGPMALRRHFRNPIITDNEFVAGITASGTSALVFNGTGAATESDGDGGTSALVFNGTGTATETDSGSGTSALVFNGTGTAVLSTVLVATTDNPLRIKQGDTFPELRSTLLDTSGNPVNLTNATSVIFRMSNYKSGVISGTAAIINAVAGLVQYAWKNTDTASAGFYAADWKVVFNDGTTKTFPQSSYQKVIVVGNLIQTLPID